MEKSCYHVISSSHSHAKFALSSASYSRCNRVHFLRKPANIRCHSDRCLKLFLKRAILTEVMTGFFFFFTIPLTAFVLLFSVSDTDPRVLEKQELQQPTYVALSYINR